MNTNIIQKLWLFSKIFLFLLTVQMSLLFSLTTEIKDDMTTNIQIIKPITDNFHQLQISVIQPQQWQTDISSIRALDCLGDGFKEADISVQLFKTANEPCSDQS